MIVQRLFRWFSDVFESLTGRRERRAVRASERLVAASAQRMQERGDGTVRGATMAVSWLDEPKAL